MKRRFLPISLLLTIILLAQTSFVVNANGDSGKYIPRTAEQATAQSFMKSIRANQETGLIDPAWLVATEKSQSRNSAEEDWTSLGPDNYGSLTRGIVYDKEDATNNTIYIGTMGGGIFQSVNGGITWKTLKKNLMVSCMAQTESGNIYVGTGDGRSAHKNNGLSDLNYETSFEGCGLYEIKSNDFVPGTKDWKFINDIAVNGNTVYAATSEGLFKYEEGSEQPETIIDTVAYSVEVTPNGTVLAVIGNDVCIFRNGEKEVLTNDEETKLPTSDTYKIIAVSPTDDNYMYVSYLSKNNLGTGNIYMTTDQGSTWQIAYRATDMYNIYGTRGILDNAMVVYPNNPRKLLIGGLNLWVMRDEFGEGIFRMECISDGSGFQVSQSGGAFFYNYKYIHTGIQAITFNPSNPNEFFVGTEGGVFKGSYSSNGYLYEGANRYYETDENHTSVARMFSVAFSGEKNYTIGGSLDHGTISILGQADLNNVTTGSAIFPNDIATTDAAATYGSFDFTTAGGPCAMSTIDTNIMFVTTTGSYYIGSANVPIFRTNSAGADYDKENFSYSATSNKAFFSNSKAFRTPIAFFENYNDKKSIDSIKYFVKPLVKKVGDSIVIDSVYYKGHVFEDVKSNNCEYPISYTLTQDEIKAGDSIFVQDIISSTLLVAVEGKVMMTRDALKFNKKLAEFDIDGNYSTEGWWTIATITGIPNALTISADGDVAYVGTVNGKLYRIEGISDAVSKDLATADSLSVIVKEEIDATAFNGQAITSISINPEDANEVLVTLGNYGNENYVFYAEDGKTFTSVQKDLPTCPVYSSAIIKDFRKNSIVYMIGSEKGIYTSEDDMTSWAADQTVVDVPVMEIKQQLLANHDPKYIYLVDEVGDSTAIRYPAISNQGVVYIATYGRGLYKTEEYVKGASESIIENTSSSTSSSALEMNIYPNPVVSEATINFNVAETSTVSYQIYDLAGRMVQNATLGNYGQGSHSVRFNVDDLSNGTYIVRVQAGTVSNIAKILVY